MSHAYSPDIRYVLDAPGNFRLTITQAAQRANVSTKTMRRWIATGRVPAQRLGPRTIRIKAADVDRLGYAIGH